MWWAAPESFLQKIFSNATAYQLTSGERWHVVQQDTKPGGAGVFGPYNTQAEAQAQADALNSGQNPVARTESQISKGLGINKFLGYLTKPETWVRVVEVVLGTVVVVVAGNKLLGDPISKAAKTRIP